MSETEFVTTEQASELAGTSGSTIRNWVRKNRIPEHKDGIKRVDLDEAIELIKEHGSHSWHKHASFAGNFSNGYGTDDAGGGLMMIQPKNRSQSCLSL